MWQSLDINELAKSATAHYGGKKKASDFCQQLRDFSIRHLPDAAIEILLADDTQERQAETDADTENETVEVSEMAPFTLNTPPATQKVAEPEIDLEAIRAEAFTKGREALKAEMAAERDRLIETHERALNEARQTTINSMATDLVSLCHQGFEQLQFALENNIARLIAPLIGEKLTKEAIAKFIQELAGESIETDRPIIIEGAPALLDAFVVQANKCKKINLDHYQLKACEGAQLRLTYEDKVLSTRLQPLLQQLREII